MKTLNTQKAIGKILVVLIMAIAEFAVTSAQAQNFRNFNRGSSKPIIALTFGLGTRSSVITSDIDYINKMKPTLEGWESSLMFGGDKVRVRTGFGSFKTAMSDVNSMKQTSINGLVNIYVPGMTKHFRPYMITGLDVNIFEFNGTYVPKLQLLTSPPLLCTCMLPAANTLPPPPPNPGETDMTVQPEEEPGSTTPESNSGQMTSTQLVSGLGGELNFRVNGRYFSMFGEMRYGLPIGVTTQNASMNETKVKKNVALAFGVAIGLNGKRSVYKNSIR